MNGNVFKYCSYPFLALQFHKLKVLRFEFKNLQDIQVAVSHRNLPIARHLQDRVALLATAGRALQILPPAPSSRDDSSNQASGSPSEVLNATPNPPSTTAATNVPAETDTVLQPGPLSSPAAPQAPQVPRPTENLHFLSSARVDAIIEQALPLLPPGAERQGTQLPAGVNISYDITEGVVSNIQLWLELSVTRNRLLPDLIEKLDAILDSDPNTLFLPLK